MMPATVFNPKARRLAMAVLVASAALALPACAASTATTTTEAPAKVEAIAGSKVKSVTLTQRAAERLAIRTAPLVEEVGRKVVPYAAVIYDADGNTWVYTMPRPLTYVRESVAVLDISADRALLSAGPPAGTQVVVEGAAMLYGTELGVGK
jgi:hypothetical protein